MNKDEFKSAGMTYSSIIVPFNKRWRTAIENNDIKAVFRKKGPSNTKNITTIFAYVGSPVSAICAKMEVLATHLLSTDNARKYCQLAMLTEPELLQYTGGQDVYVFEIGHCTTPSKPLDRHELQREFGFRPTPSFVALSEKGAEALSKALEI